LANEHIDAAETALEFAKHSKDLGHEDEEITGYAWAGEHYLEAGMAKQAVEYLELQHKDWFGQDINQDFKPGTLLARAYLGVGRFTEALMIVNELDARLAIYPDSVSDEYPFNLHKDDPMIPWMPARLHELKLEILMAMGDSERAEIEAQFCKEAYESIEDFASATRMYQTISSLRKVGSKPAVNETEAASNALSFFAEGR
jgi:tetratricopeptide (TPR) repeat protein